MTKTEIVAATLAQNNVMLAPMAGVTDRVFRSICKEKGCGMTFTEMVSAKGLHYGTNAKTGVNKSENLLVMAEEEKPACVQLFGREPVMMAEQAKRICDDCGDSLAWIDINMGCPAPKITKNGEGSSLMKEPLQAAEIISTVEKAIDKPLTVKMRLGWDDPTINVVEFATIAQDAGASAVCVHGRTRQQFYSGEADWSYVTEIKKRLSIPVIGNGDVFDAITAKKRLEESGVDALLIARGAQGNPWIFAQIRAYLDYGKMIEMPSNEERFDIITRHAKGLMEFRHESAITEMRKHIGWYIAGVSGAAKARHDINQCTTFEQVQDMLAQLLMS